MTKPQAERKGRGGMRAGVHNASSGYDIPPCSQQ